MVRQITGRSAELEFNGKVYFRLFYDGVRYRGWSKQKSGLTVQAVLERALMETGCELGRLRAFSRTDAGVRALSQIVALEGQSIRPLAVNRVLPDDMAITHYTTRLGEVLSKTYVYVKNGRWLHPKTVIKACDELYRMDVSNMFYKKGGAKPSGPLKTEFISTHTDEFIFFKAKGFGYQQLRRIVGYLTFVDSIGEIPKRYSNIHPARPEGLILLNIDSTADWVELAEGLAKVKRYLSSKISELEWSLSVYRFVLACF
ncbi:MAG: hypothetical protein QW453_02185 [Thermoprotei archaeon]